MSCLHSRLPLRATQMISQTSTTRSYAKRRVSHKIYLEAPRQSTTHRRSVGKNNRCDRRIQHAVQFLTRLTFEDVFRTSVIFRSPNSPAHDNDDENDER
ncbi:hypothetical protein V3C99_018117 [Haemonchus contortus]|uniref:Secreted protein n=1 Tax=Haemonchus contortus TaxID=6289 RepID=A0A7I5EEF7_HAECO